MNGRDFTKAVNVQRDLILADRTEPLAAAYGKVMRRYGRIAAANFRTLQPVLAAARPDELYDPADLAAAAAEATRAIRRGAAQSMIEGVLAAAAVAFDVAPLAVDALTAQIGIRSRDLDASMRDVLTRTIDRAVMEGWTVPQTATAIQAGVDGIAGYTATMLARSDLISLANGGSIVAGREILGEGATKTWLCLTGDSVPQGFPIRVARRFYSGSMVAIRTSGWFSDPRMFHSDLTVTPNHSILTERGWVSAQLIEPGDRVIGCSGFDVEASMVQPNVQGAPPTISEFFDAAADISAPVRMMGTVVNLDGEWEDSEVDVVTIDSELRNRIHPSLDEEVAKDLFALSDVRLGECFARGPSTGGFVGDSNSASCVVPSASRGERIVSIKDPPGRPSRGLVALLDPDKTEDPADGACGTPERGANTATRFTRLVSPLDVVSVEIIPWSGHVYDLETETGWFVANGMIVHNSSQDDRVRPTHEEADGQTVPLDGRFQVGDDLLDYPGDPQGTDAEVVQCRCVLIYDEQPVTAAAVNAGQDGDADLAMVAVYPAEDEQAALAVDGGQEPETIHCTMVFLGEADSFDWQAANRAVLAAARDTAAMAGKVDGAGCFAGGPDGAPMIALPNVYGLSALRARLVAALADEGIASPSEHDWVPHMTIRYSDDSADLPVDKIGQPLTFATVSLVRADTRTDYSLSQEASVTETATIELTAGAPETRVPILASGTVIGHVTLVPGSASFGDEPVTAATTIVIDGEGIAEVEAEPLGWVSDIAFEGTATGDGRWIAPGALSWRDPPLTLMGLLLTGPGGHEGAEVAGRMDTFERDAATDMDGSPLAEGVTAIRSYGVFDVGEFGTETGRMVDDEVVRGISVDLAILEWAFRDPDTGEILQPEDMDEEQWDRAFFGELQYAVLAAEIMAATVCPTPAFADARIAAVRASSGEREVTLTLWAPIRVAAPVTASAAGMAPLKPPADWFKNPGLADLTPLTVTDEGRVFGHLAAWNACHTGLAGCVPPPRNCNYDATFHLGAVACDDGTEVSAGQITLDGPHASLRLTPGAVMRHYDDTTTAVADVRVGEDAFGPWVAGALRPDVSAAKVRALKAAKMSGDWRPIRGKNELLAILNVNVPGFIVPRPIAASGFDGEALADALGTPVEADGIALRVLAARAEGGMDALAALAEGVTA